MESENQPRFDDHRWRAALNVCFGAAACGAVAAVVVCVLVVAGVIRFQTAFYVWCSSTFAGAVIAYLVTYRGAWRGPLVRSQHDENYYKPAT